MRCSQSMAGRLHGGRGAGKEKRQRSSEGGEGGQNPSGAGEEAADGRELQKAIGGSGGGATTRPNGALNDPRRAVLPYGEPGTGKWSLSSRGRRIVPDPDMASHA